MPRKIKKGRITVKKQQYSKKIIEIYQIFIQFMKNNRHTGEGWYRTYYYFNHYPASSFGYRVKRLFFTATQKISAFYMQLMPKRIKHQYLHLMHFLQ